ncbi:16259_t:CDS:2, partial [Acaulospora colombiana]
GPDGHPNYAARRRQEEWTSLAMDIKDRLESVQNAVKDQSASPDLQVLVSNYSQELEHVLRGLILSNRSQSSSTKAVLGTIKTALTVDNEREKIKHSIAQMNEAYNRFMVGLQILIRKGVEELQNGQTHIHQTIQDHRTEHAESYAQIRAVYQEQLEAKNQFIEAEEINLIKGMVTAHLANGSVHQKCMNGTRHSLLGEIDEWRVKSDSSQILWLSGVAGVGKSTVARELVDKWKLDGHLAGCFFFSRDTEETRVSRLFFTTVAQQGLSRLDSQAQTVVADGIRKLFDPLSATLEEQCTHLFVNPIKTIRDPTVLVLDAMDECDPDACEQLLRIVLSELSNIPLLKLLITSRPEVHIQRQLELHKVQEISLRLNDGSNTQDVETYMRSRLQKVNFPEDQVLKLVERAGGLFIWAKTVCDLIRNLRGDRDTFINRVLAQNLRQIDPIYRIALEQAIGRNDEEENVQAYMAVLKLITAAYEPLSPNTINRLLGIPNSMDIINDLRSVLECRGPEEVVRFLHPTFRDFLCNSPNIDLYRVDINKAHGLIGIGCLKMIYDELHYDTCKLFDHRDRVLKPEALEVLRIQNISSALRYSCSFWGIHLTSQMKGTVQRDEVISHIETFFTRNLLDWLYIIGVQGSIDNAFNMLRELIATGIQVYARSILFPHPTITMGTELDWPSTMTVQTYDIQASILLPFDDLLATGGQREDMPVFSVWDIKTTDGVTCTHPCGAKHCAVTHLSFIDSGDTVLLHTGCNCGKLCKWRVSNYHCSLLSQITFESDGICIAWADDGTKAITFCMIEQTGYKRNQSRKYYCNTYTDDGSSTRCQIFDGQKEGEEKGNITSRIPWIRFTPCSGKRFIYWTSNLSGNKVAIFESSSGRLISQESYPQNLKEMHFSPDGRNILLWFSSSQRLKLVSSEDGSDLWDWILQDGFIKKVQFFPNTAQVLLLSTSTTYIVDSLNGSTLYRRDTSESLLPCCSVISPSGERVAVHSSGKVEIMDHTLGEYREEHSAEERGHLLHFSWAHSTLVFMQDHYDGRSALSFQRLSSSMPAVDTTSDPNSCVTNVFLSPNGKFLLTVHNGESFCLWNTALGLKIPIVGDEGSRTFQSPQIQWAKDSSAALIWSSDRLVLFRTNTGYIQTILLPTITPHMLDESTYLSICRVPSPPESIHELLVSPQDQSVALICEQNLGILDLGDGSYMDPLGQGKFRGGGFSPDGTRFCALESSAYLNTVFIVWCIEIPSHSVRKCHIQLQPTWHWPKLRSVTNLTSENRSILGTLTSQ